MPSQLSMDPQHPHMDTNRRITSYHMGAQGGTFQIWKVLGSWHHPPQPTPPGVKWHIYQTSEECLYQILLPPKSWTFQPYLFKIHVDLLNQPGGKWRPTPIGVQIQQTTRNSLREAWKIKWLIVSRKWFHHWGKNHLHHIFTGHWDYTIHGIL